MARESGRDNRHAAVGHMYRGVIGGKRRISSFCACLGGPAPKVLLAVEYDGFVGGVVIGVYADGFEEIVYHFVGNGERFGGATREIPRRCGGTPFCERGLGGGGGG